MNRSSWILGEALLAGLVLGWPGCTPDVNVGLTTWQDEFLQAPSVAADILFVVDNSQSMTQELGQVVDSFGEFIGNIQESNTEFQIGVTTTNMSDTSYSQAGTQGRLVEYNGFRYITHEMDPSQYSTIFAGMISVISEQDGSGYEKGLQAARAALYPVSEGGNMGSNGYNKGFLRDAATLAIIFLSDEDDCSDENLLDFESQQECYTRYAELRPVYQYVSEYQAIKDRDEDAVVSAIVGPKGLSSDSSCGQNTVAGTRYIEATEAMGGVVGNICDSSFATILNELGLSAAGIMTRFELSRAARADSIQVYIDEEEVPESAGWRYLEEEQVVECTGAAIPQRGSTIRITYQAD